MRHYDVNTIKGRINVDDSAFICIKNTFSFTFLIIHGVHLESVGYNSKSLSFLTTVNNKAY